MFALEIWAVRLRVMICSKVFVFGVSGFVSGWHRRRQVWLHEGTDNAGGNQCCSYTIFDPSRSELLRCQGTDLEVLLQMSAFSSRPIFTPAAPSRRNQDTSSPFLVYFCEKPSVRLRRVIQYSACPWRRRTRTHFWIEYWHATCFPPHKKS